MTCGRSAGRMFAGNRRPTVCTPAFCLRSFDWPDQRAKSAPLWNKLMQQIQPLGAENVRELR